MRYVIISFEVQSKSEIKCLNLKTSFVIHRNSTFGYLRQILCDLKNEGLDK